MDFLPVLGAVGEGDGTVDRNGYENLTFVSEHPVSGSPLLPTLQIEKQM